MSAAEWVPDGASIEELRVAATRCHGCELWEPATQVVFSAGNLAARLVLVGEQPGDVEDRRGIPFVGPAGKLLQRALADAGVPPGEVYVTNAVKHFRFTERGKRRIHATPQITHIQACRPWLEAELRVLDSALIVALGATAGKSLLGGDFRISVDRGRVLDRETPIGRRRVLATPHPSAILRADDAEREAAYAGLVADLRLAATTAEVVAP